MSDNKFEPHYDEENGWFNIRHLAEYYNIKLEVREIK